MVNVTLNIDRLMKHTRSQLISIIADQKETLEVLRFKLRKANLNLATARVIISDDQKLINRKKSQIKSLKKRVRKRGRRNG